MSTALPKAVVAFQIITAAPELEVTGSFSLSTMLVDAGGCWWHAGGMLVACLGGLLRSVQICRIVDEVMKVNDSH